MINANDVEFIRDSAEIIDNSSGYIGIRMARIKVGDRYKYGVAQYDTRAGQYYSYARSPQYFARMTKTGFLCVTILVSKSTAYKYFNMYVNERVERDKY